MSNINKMHEIYELLPAVYREQDAVEGYPLRALLDIIQEQADILHTDIWQLWDDFFIETCKPWVIPYIGDLISNNLLFDASRIEPSKTADDLFRDLTGPDLLPDMAVRIRADVAKTIYYRRRKGTLPMLEELARDVTGWAAHGVEFFRLLEWTQNLNHLRFEAEDCIDLRNVEKVDRLDGAFDLWSHTVDVRHPAQTEGWHNIPNIGFFLWRLQSYPLTLVQARQAAGASWQYHFSPLGNPAPLFNGWRREGDESGLTTEVHVPGPIRPPFFFDDLRRYRLQQPPRLDVTDLYGSPLDQGGSFYIEYNEDEVNPAIDPSAEPDLFQPQIICRCLNPWPSAQPSREVIAVDVEHGRLAVGDDFADSEINVFYHYGFSADMGGGPYERGKWMIDPSLSEEHFFVQQDAAPGSGIYTTIGDALNEWEGQEKPNTIITILDNRTYSESIDIEPADDTWLVIEAANNARPHIQPADGRIRITGAHPDGLITLSGLLVEGGVEVQGDFGTLRLIHTTLVPGRELNEEDGQPATTDPSVLVADTLDGTPDGGNINTNFELHAAYSIIGPVRMPEHARNLYLLDCIVDGIGGTAIAATGTTDHQPVPAATIERTTIFGQSFFKGIDLATEVIFTEPVTAEERHKGCVRFSFVPHGSTTPRRYHCQPDFEIARVIRKAKDRAKAEGNTLSSSELDEIRTEIQAWLAPTFTSKNYGDPGYGQLRITSPIQIRTGAEDGSEMGAFSHLKQPQRETNLRIRLDEYLPFGLVPGIIYVT